MRVALRAAAACAVTCLVFDAGVSSGGAQTGGSWAAKRITVARDRTIAAGSANVMMTVGIAAGDESAYIRGDGGFDFVLDRGLMFMDFSGAPPFQPEAKVEYRLLGGRVYADFALIEDVARELPEGKHWIKIDPRHGELAPSGSETPIAELEALRGVSKDVQSFGTEDVRGAPATHYKATTEPKRALDRLPKNSRRKVGRILHQQFGDRPFPVDVWINDQERVVRVQVALNLANLPKAARKAGTARVTAEYFAFGAPLYVYSPPESETIDFKDAFGDLRGSSAI